MSELSRTLLDNRCRLIKQCRLTSDPYPIRLPNEYIQLALDIEMRHIAVGYVSIGCWMLGVSM